MVEQKKPRVPKPGTSPTGRPRRPRLAQSETRRRVLRAAATSAASGGLTVGLEHLSFEDAIRAADVSRTAAYRCWPHKDAFLADLAVELAEQAIPATPTRGPQSTTTIRSVIGEQPDLLARPAGRAKVLDTVVRRTATEDFDLDRTEVARWRTYLALVMSLQTMPAGPLHDKVSAAIAAVDERMINRVSGSYRLIVEFFGRRATVDYPVLARIGIALMRGLVVGDLARPGTSPADVARPDDGELPAVAFAAMVSSNTEVVDTGTWDRPTITERLDAWRATDIFADVNSAAP